MTGKTIATCHWRALGREGGGKYSHACAQTGFVTHYPGLWQGEVHHAG